MKIVISHILLMFLLVGLIGKATGHDKTQSKQIEVELVDLKAALLQRAHLDKDAIKELHEYQRAREKGSLDLLKTEDPFVAINFHEDYLYYQFYNNILPINSDYEFAIQRVEKRVTNYLCNSNEAIQNNSYLVEVFKLAGGKLKRHDGHWGHFSLGYCKRKIVKIFEVGLGSIKELATEKTWPFKRNILYKLIQKYQTDKDYFNQINFKDVERWKMELVFDVEGNYSLRIVGKNFDILKTSRKNPVF